MLTDPSSSGLLYRPAEQHDGVVRAASPMAVTGSEEEMDAVLDEALAALSPSTATAPGQDADQTTQHAMQAAYALLQHDDVVNSSTGMDTSHGDDQQGLAGATIWEQLSQDSDNLASEGDCTGTNKKLDLTYDQLSELMLFDSP